MTAKCEIGDDASLGVNKSEEISMVRAFLVALALLGTTSSAMADGIDDFEGCKAAATERIPVDVALKAGFCMGIVEGLMWSLPGWGAACLPKGVTTGQGVKVLVKYMDDHPEELHDRTAELAFRAFVKAWPCSR